jgi:PTH1 family peptidyl-tRNA hydrolase
MSERYLVVGLGNPGREYNETRHNVGFRCADALVKAHHLRFDPKKKSKGKVAEGTIAGKQVLVAKPQTFMNLSGSTVQGLASFYKIPPERILVIFDDLDLPPGTLRIRQKGGSGGHRGLTDIIRRLGTQDFPRIRFGIGRPPGRMEPAAFVLQRFSGEDEKLVAQTVERAVKAVELWLTEGINSAMNRFNGTGDNLVQPVNNQISSDSSDSTT